MHACARHLLILAVAAFVPSPITSAETHLMLPDGSGDFTTIQAAIDAAADGDVIELGDGVYCGPGNRDVSFNNKAVTLRSASGDPRTCIIQCDGMPDDPHRGFSFSMGECETSVLSGITISHGLQSAGGAVYCAGNASPLMQNCILEDNVSTATAGGGAICCYGRMAISDCVFERNSARRGGALYCPMGGEVNCVRCRFEENAAASYGGAVYAHATPIFIECSFANNESGNRGGALFAGAVTLARCVLCANSSAGRGAALELAGPAESRLASCTIVTNLSEEDGIIHCGDDATVMIANTIIAFSPCGSAVSCTQNGLVELECSDLYGNAGGDWVGCASGQSGEDGNISLDPLFCGATQDPEDPYLLRGDSPCAPFSEPNPECDLIGACPVGCPGPQAVGDERGGQEPAGLTWSLAPAVLSPAVDAIRMMYELDTRNAADVVQLGVHDLAGRLVCTIVHAPRQAGGQTVSWDGSDALGRPVGAGVYLCRLSAGGLVVTRRVVVIR